MKNKDLVVKTHKLNTAIYSLSLSEVRLMQLAIIDARETGNGLTSEKPLRISASRYAERFDVTTDTAYQIILKAEKSLMKRQFQFLSDRGNNAYSNWLQEVEYIRNEGAIEILFTSRVVKEITRIDVYKDFFSAYQLEKIVGLNSVYSVRLYELLVQWKASASKKTPVFELDVFRAQMGLEENQYSTMSNFKKRVLDCSVDEINKKTDLNVSYEQKKKGRTIVGLTFTVLEKTKTKPSKEIDANTNADVIPPKEMKSAKQRSYFAKLLSEDSAFGSKYALPIWSTYEFAQWINEELAKPERILEWAKPLNKVGFYSGEKKQQSLEPVKNEELSNKAEPAQEQPRQDSRPKTNEGKPISLKELLEAQKIATSA